MAPNETKSKTQVEKLLPILALIFAAFNVSVPVALIRLVTLVILLAVALLIGVLLVVQKIRPSLWEILAFLVTLIIITSAVSRYWTTPRVEISFPQHGSHPEFFAHAASSNVFVRGKATRMGDLDYIELWAKSSGKETWWLAAGPIPSLQIRSDGEWKEIFDSCKQNLEKEATIFLKALVLKRRHRICSSDSYLPTEGFASGTIVIDNLATSVSARGVAPPSMDQPKAAKATALAAADRFDIMSPPDGSILRLSQKPLLIVSGTGWRDNCKIMVSLRKGSVDSCLQQEPQHSGSSWLVDCTEHLLEPGRHKIIARIQCKAAVGLAPSEIAREHNITVVE